MSSVQTLCSVTTWIIADSSLSLTLSGQVGYGWGFYSLLQAQSEAGAHSTWTLSSTFIPPFLWIVDFIPRPLPLYCKEHDPWKGAAFLPVG